MIKIEREGTAEQFYGSIIRLIEEGGVPAIGKDNTGISIIGTNWKVKVSCAGDRVSVFVSTLFPVSMAIDDVWKFGIDINEKILLFLGADDGTYIEMEY